MKEEITYNDELPTEVVDATKEKNRYWRIYQRYFIQINGKILDAGCSVGNFISNDPKNIAGIDTDRKALEICKQRGYKVYEMDMNQRLNFPDNYFSAICSDRTIEHTKDTKFTLSEFFRVLKPKGKLFLSTQNLYEVKFGFFDDYTHNRPMTPKSLKQVAMSVGFKHGRVSSEHKSIHGLGWLARKGVPAMVIFFMQKVLYYLLITDCHIVLEAEK